ncbi:MAG: VWA domain-containing protein [Phycisphaerales bacterium]|nr:VWA domain-containing protein [Phycisphaerales bacterium]
MKWCVMARFVGVLSLIVTILAPSGAWACGRLIVSTQGEDVPAVCPLQHTDVHTEIHGMIARTVVRQVFSNPATRKIDALYTFPLPHLAAVDDMRIVIGAREVIGEVRPREEARAIYEDARAKGHVAALLDQERPNIFTQAVANIEPGVQIIVEIAFVETLRYDEGVLEWVFPMVVGPRYIPGGGSAPAPMTRATATGEVPDAERISPPVTPKGTRAGHDIALTLDIFGGSELFDLSSPLHETVITSDGPGHARVTLAKKSEIPNRDFVLRYRLAREEIGDSYVVERDPTGLYFTLVLQPPRRVQSETVVPRELIFVLDTSGSMNGFPMDKSRELMRKALASMRSSDTFNIITFAGRTEIMWPAPRPATAENVAEAQAFVAGQQSGGGTEMMRAIEAALVQAPQSGHAAMRVVCFLTDGYVGNDMAIIDAVRKNAASTRVFSFGIGNSVNRFLLDGMAGAGRGEVEYVTTQEAGDAAVERFTRRIDAPVLADISVDWGDLPVEDVYPRMIPDLFAEKPVVIHGRLREARGGVIRLKGRNALGAFEREVRIDAPQATADGGEEPSALASLWARARVEFLMNENLAAVQSGTLPTELREAITALGVKHRLMTQFTSFVAVERTRVTIAGESVLVDVPVEMPDGVSYEGVFGGDKAGVVVGRGFAKLDRAGGGERFAMQPSARPPTRRTESAGGVAGTPAASAPPPGAPVAADALGQTTRDDGDAIREVATASADNKLDAALRDLAERVAQAGETGDLTVGTIRVEKHRVAVMIVVSEISDAVREALAKLGFESLGDVPGARTMIGTIDVRKLAELVKQDAVLNVRPLRRGS